MSKWSEELRKHARELTRNVTADDDSQAQERSLGLAQACIALARNEEWLDGEVSPVEKSTNETAASRGLKVGTARTMVLGQARHQTAIP